MSCYSGSAMHQVAVPDRHGPSPFTGVLARGVRSRLRLLAGVLCLLLAGAAWGGEVALDSADMVPLTRVFGVLEDPGAQLTLDDVRSPEAQGRFKPVPAIGPGPNFGITRSAYWLQVTLRTSPDAAPEWLLEVPYPPLDRIELYVPDGPGYRRQVGGDHFPFASRAIVHRNHVFPIRLQPGAAATVYLRISSQGTVSAPVRLWRPAALWQHDQATYAGLSLYFGLLVGLLLYNLLLFASVRDRAYLIYSAFVAAMGLGQAALDGLGAQFLWTPLTWWNQVSVPGCLATAAIFGLQFARTFLSSAARMPLLDRLLVVQIGGWALTLLAALVLPYTVSAYMVTTLSLVSAATVAALGGTSVIRGYPGARYFFVAWALLLLGVVILSLHNAGMLPSNALTANALLIGSAMEMVLLSFALADRINVARRFKEQAQSRIAAERAMVEAISQSQDRVKQVLKEREVILENSIVGIALIGTDGRLRWANRAMFDIFGAKEGTTASMEPFYVSREQSLHVNAQVAQAVARGEVFEDEVELQRLDGSHIWVLLSGKAVSQDLSQGMVWVMRDVTGRRRLQQQLDMAMPEGF